MFNKTAMAGIRAHTIINTYRRLNKGGVSDELCQNGPHCFNHFAGGYGIGAWSEPMFSEG
jgi:hypothetical protein